MAARTYLAHFFQAREEDFSISGDEEEWDVDVVFSTTDAIGAILRGRLIRILQPEDDGYAGQVGVKRQIWNGYECDDPHSSTGRFRWAILGQERSAK